MLLANRTSGVCPDQPRHRDVLPFGNATQHDVGAAEAREQHDDGRQQNPRRQISPWIPGNEPPESSARIAVVIAMEAAAGCCRASGSVKVRTSMLPGRRHGRSRLRQEILRGARSAVVKRPAMHRRKFRPKVAVARGARRFPLECRGLPRVVLRRALAGKDADEEIHQEDKLSGREEERGNRDEHVQTCCGCRNS